MSPPPPARGFGGEAAQVRRLSAGIVAHNEERTVRAAIRSLLDQRLPTGTRWDRLWVVASGCTDRTVERVEAIAAQEPRIGLVVETERLGKAHALAEVFSRAEGEALVLLNADAVAEPGAVAALLAAAPGPGRPYAVMGRPVVRTRGNRLLAGAIELQWELHHGFHLATVDAGGGNHLSDELLLVGRPDVPAVPDGVVNDGSYLGVWLREHGGLLRYAPEARVRVAVPAKTADHLSQRRRIRWGHAQVAGLLGRCPSTLPALFWADPPRALHVVGEALRTRHRGLRSLAVLAAAELAAAGLAAWDRLPPARDHVRWKRIRDLPSPHEDRWDEPPRPEVS